MLKINKIKSLKHSIKLTFILQGMISRYLNFVLDNKNNNPIKFHRIPFCGIDFGESPKKLFYLPYGFLYGAVFLAPRGMPTSVGELFGCSLNGQAVWPMAIVK